MIRVCLILLSFIVLSPALSHAGDPYFVHRIYDEHDGLSQRAVKQVVEDDNGVLWVATWNGLNRFDGYDFKCIRPGNDEEVRKYSSRIRDIKLGTRGYLWCRIDDRIVRFDVNTYSFYDSHSRLEERLGFPLSVTKIFATADDCIVLMLEDGRYVVMTEGESPENNAYVSETRPKKKIRPTNARVHETLGQYEERSVMFSTVGGNGDVWLVTNDGNVMYAQESTGSYVKMARIDDETGELRYGTTDRQGNVWLCGKNGLHKLTFGIAPYTLYRYSPYGHSQGSMLRSSYRDSSGNVWMSWSDVKGLMVTDGSLSSPRYVGGDGSLNEKMVSFGSAVYSIFESSPDVIWVGAKPDGLYRLTKRPDSSGYSVSHYVNNPSESGSLSGNAYYDGVTDSHGRLWLASLGTGVDVVRDPSADKPVFENLMSLNGYPKSARSVRRLMVIGDSMVVAATTGGLLTFNIPEPFVLDSIRFTLHVSEPGRASSLGNIATMDICLGNDGNLYVATESDGVERVLTSPLSPATDSWDFRSYHFNVGSNPDVSLAVAPYGNSDSLIVNGFNDIYLLSPSTGDIKAYGESFWHRDMRFSDARPLMLEDGSWLIGLADGAVRVDMADNIARTDSFSLVFNSVAIGGRNDSLISPMSDRIVLGPDERNVSIRFSALCYGNTSSVCYSFKVDDGEWTPLGTLRSVTFADMAPGKYKITVRSTDTYGQWLDNEASIILDVVPKFWETGIAKFLYVLVALLIVGVVIWTVLYVRRIKRIQRETLASHLRMLESRAEVRSDGESAPTVVHNTSAEDADVARRLSDDDRQLMDSLMDYIETHLSDSSVTVDDMANAASVSRSSLTRKMKTLMGVTPAEFLRETRLTRASSLLSGTDKPIKEIAMDCGFSDMNYFGKCFKSSRGVTPGAFRKTARD